MSPYLKTGTAVACFKDLGKVPATIEELIIHVVLVIMTGRDSLKDHKGILSELQ